MGRYYSGDIEGKFWFGVQESTDPEFFGGAPCEPRTIEYSFTGDDIPEIKDGIEKCKTALGDNKAKLDAFFSKEGEGYAGGGYTDEALSKHLGLNNAFDVLQWYARLELGEKILACVEETGECSFTAEL